MTVYINETKTLTLWPESGWASAKKVTFQEGEKLRVQYQRNTLTKKLSLVVEKDGRRIYLSRLLSEGIVKKNMHLLECEVQAYSKTRCDEIINEGLKNIICILCADEAKGKFLVSVSIVGSKNVILNTFDLGYCTHEKIKSVQIGVTSEGQAIFTDLACEN